MHCGISSHNERFCDFSAALIIVHCTAFSKRFETHTYMCINYRIYKKNVNAWHEDIGIFVVIILVFFSNGRFSK